VPLLFCCACRLLKRLRDEEGSRFQGQPVLHQRYVLLALLGRGGFSEVHKAYDLATLKFVAVKVRGLAGLMLFRLFVSWRCRDKQGPPNYVRCTRPMTLPASSSWQ
jgi:hypothetical protein